MSTQGNTSATTPLGRQLVAALDDDERPAPAGVLRACSTFAWRGLLKIRHVPEQLVDATIGPVLLLTMFTYLFGGAIEGSTGEYLQFVLPGALVMAVLLTTTHSGIALYADRTRGVVDRFRSMPVWAPAPLVGAVAGDAVRYALAVTTVLLAGLLLGFDAAGGVPGVLAGALLVVVFAFAVSWIFTAGGLAVRSQSAVQSAALIGVLVPVLVSNVFVEPSTLPAVLQAVVEINPISHLTTAVRGLLSGGPAAQDILLVLAEATVITAIFAPLTWRQYRRG